MVFNAPSFVLISRKCLTGQAWTSALFLLDGTAEVGMAGEELERSRETPKKEARDVWILHTYITSTNMTSKTIYIFL